MSFSDRIWSAFINSWGILIALIGFVASILTYFVAPKTDTVQLNIFLVVLFVMTAIIVILFRSLFEVHNDSALQLPKVRKVLKPPSAYKKASALLLVEPCTLLSYDSSVTLFSIEDDYESLLGIGVVINIQNDKKIQIALYENNQSIEAITQLKENKKHDLDRLVLKPSVPKAFIEGEI